MSETINIKALFFATLKDRAGVSHTSVELPEGARVVDLKAALAELFPGLSTSLTSVLVSVNREYAFDQDLLPADGEVAFFPPVSGGDDAHHPTIYAITEVALDLNDLLASITLPSTGAAGIFTGMVRALTERGETRETAYLHYEAYIPMAEEKMRQVADEIRARWPQVEGIAIVQRIGRLEPGTPTVLIACTAAHRDSGVFDAARYGIDRLKQIVPIWKKEVGSQGEAWIEGEYIPDPGD